MVRTGAQASALVRESVSMVSVNVHLVGTVITATRVTTTALITAPGTELVGRTRFVIVSLAIQATTVPKLLGKSVPTIAWGLGGV